MSHEAAAHYRREADRLFAEIRTLSDADAQAALLQMARQYLKLAEHHDALAFLNNDPWRDPTPA
jgi:thioredoxin-like negative regulator of GroEL